MEQLVTDYLKKTGLDIAEEYCQKLIASHPDYPAITSVADTFDQLGINYAVGRKDPKGISEIPTPYLLHMNPSDLMLIESDADLTDKAEYLKNAWSGIIIKVDDEQQLTNDSHQKEFNKEHNRKLGSKALVVLGVLALTIPVLGALSWVTGLWFLTAVIGLAIGMVLVRKELGLTGIKVEEFCRAGKNSDCGEVLESDAATIWRGIKLTDMVIGYFSFQLLMVLLASWAPSSITTLVHLGVISWLALPMVLYSYYYQGVVTKKWCKLCLLVTFVLISQGAMSVYLYAPLQSEVLWAPQAIALALVLLPLAIGLTTYLKTKFAENQKLVSEHVLAMRIVQSPNVFTAQISQESNASPQAFDHHITLGNPAAPHQLLLSLNLNCEPCRDLYHKLYEVLQEIGDQFSVSLTFAPNNKRDGIADNEYMIQYWLENVRGKEDETHLTAELLKAWYKKIDSKSFRKSHPLKATEMSKETQRLIEDHMAWSQLNGVERSPTMFLNRRLVPMNYRMELLAPTLRYLLADLPKPQVQAQTV